MPQQLPIVQQPFALSTAFVPATAPHHKTNPPLQTWWFICQESHILTIATQANSSETMGAMGYSLPQSPTLGSTWHYARENSVFGLFWPISLVSRRKWLMDLNPLMALSLERGGGGGGGGGGGVCRSLHTQLPEGPVCDRCSAPFKSLRGIVPTSTAASAPLL